MSNEALRVLALGIRYWDEEPQEFTSEMIENNLTFIGMVGMIDPHVKKLNRQWQKLNQLGSERL